MTGFVKNEVIRIWGNYKLWLVLAAMLALNLCILLISFSVDDISPATYKSVKSEVMEQPELITDAYFNNMDSPVYERLYKEYMSVLTYPAYVKHVMDDVDENSEISIFQNEFSRRNLKKTKDDYESLKGISPEFVGSYGLEKAVSFYGSDAVVLLIIIIAVNSLFIQDKKNGMISLTRSARYGDGRLAFAKIFSVFSYVAVFGLIVFVSNIMLSAVMYGGVSPDAPVQSMMEYAQTGIHLSIGAFLVRMFLHKLLVYFFLSVVMVLLAIFSSNEIVLYIGVAAFCVVEMLAYVIGMAARLVLLRSISIVHMLNLSEYYEYYNYDVFNHPVTDSVIDTGILMVEAVVCLLAGLYAFSHCSPEYRSISHYRRKGRRERLYGLMAVSGQQFLFGYRIIIVIAALVIFQAVTYAGSHAGWYADELYYRSYMKQLEGEITEEKLAYIDDELERMEQIHEDFDRLDNDFNEDLISQREYEKQAEKFSAELAKEPALDRCREYVDYITSLDAPDTVFVYDRGWNYLFGNSSYKNDIKNGAILVIAALLGVSFMYAEEYKYKMNVLTNISAKRMRLAMVKAFTTLLYILMIFMLIYLPELLWVNREFGLTHKDANALSVMLLSDVGMNISIRGYCVLVYLIRFVTICVISLVTACLCKCIRNTNQTIIVAAIIFLLPLLLNMMGIHAFDRYTCNILLSGNMLLRGGA